MIFAISLLVVVGQKLHVNLHPVFGICCCLTTLSCLEMSGLGQAGMMNVPLGYVCVFNALLII